MSLDKRLGNLSFTGCGIGRDHQRVIRPTGGDKTCGCCGATGEYAEGRVCGTCRRQENDPCQDPEWRMRVAEAIAREPKFWYEQ
jgi:hypothetical protein